MAKVNKKKADGTTLIRSIKLIVKLLGMHGQVPADFLSDSAWGSPTTVRRLLKVLNSAWESERGELLFEFVNAAGTAWTQGEDRFIRLRDGAVRFAHTSNLAVIPAYMQLLRLLQGTFLEQDFQTLYDQGRQNLSKKERLYLDRSSRKFYNIIKGAKDYSQQSEQVKQVYKGLLQEKVLSVTRRKSDGTEAKENLLPLSILLFQGGLYLLANSPDHPDARPKSYRLETLIEVICTRKKFRYPANFDPSAFFKDTFGIFQGESTKIYKVEIEILSPDVVEYLRARRWTANDEYIERAGKTSLRMQVNNLTEVASWVLSFGPSIRVVAPKELRDRVRTSLSDAANNY